MTIKELEEKTGLARANIRYYEQQGLVHPVRRENGYRDYSQQDLQALGKIKLLRHLGLSIETIRTVQAGELTLSAALAEREEELSRESAMLAREKLVCGELRRRQVDYDALEPEGYLVQLEAEETAAGNASTVPRPETGDVIVPLRRPWRRFFARNLDWMLYGWLWNFCVAYILRIGPMPEGVERVLQWCMAVLLMLLLEPLLLSRWGTTPGKWFFGLRITDVCGQNLTYDQALRRTWWVLMQGMGLNVPGLNLYFPWKSYERCMAGIPAAWEENTVCTMCGTRAWRTVAFCALCAGLLCSSFWMAAQQLTVHSKGGVQTKQAFIASCNRSVQLDDAGEERPYRLFLNSNGQWQVTDEALMEYPYTSPAGYGAPMEYEILVGEDYGVDGVQIAITGGDELYVDDLIRQTWYSYEALRSEQGSFWGSLAVTRDYYKVVSVPEFFMTGGSGIAGNVRIDCQVDSAGVEMCDVTGRIGIGTEFYDGYALRRSQTWNAAEEDWDVYEGEPFYHCTVTLTLVD